MSEKDGDIIIRIDRRAAKLMAYAATAGLLALVGQAMPAIADVVNSFSAGEKISAAAVNDNFADLDGRVGVFEGALTVGDDGNVGLGAVSLEERLNIEGFDESIIRIKNKSSGSSAWRIGQLRTDGSFDLHYSTHPSVLNVGTTGKVGIGTTDPTDAKLAIQSDQDGEIFEGLLIRNTGSSDGSGAALLFGTYPQSWTAAIKAVRDGGGVRNSLTFHTHDNSNVNERMRLTADGYLGIGTDSPTHDLHVNGNLRSGSLILDQDANAQCDAGRIRFTGSKFQGCTGSVWVDLH